jgi:hypothetical protein
MIPLHGMAVLEEASAAGELLLQWGPDRQMFQYGSQTFRNEGPTRTEPSHDLAHLLIAANGRLPWCPVGPDREIRLAEYNAFLLEHLLDKVHGAVTLQPRTQAAMLGEARRHASWFVEQHYAPFPLSAEQAYNAFVAAIDPDAICRLSPLFFRLREDEMGAPAGSRRPVEIRFFRTDAPAAGGKATDFARGVGRLLEHMLHAARC